MFRKKRPQIVIPLEDALAKNESPIVEEPPANNVLPTELAQIENNFRSEFPTENVFSPLINEPTSTNITINDITLNEETITIEDTKQEIIPTVIEEIANDPPNFQQKQIGEVCGIKEDRYYRRERPARAPRRQVDFDGNLMANIANEENVRNFHGDVVSVKGFEDKRVTLETANLDPKLLHNIKNLQKYSCLLPLQEACLGIMLDEKRPNVLVQSPTGSGKTAAFGIPACQIAKEYRSRAGPSVIIVCNTMNLAMQIRDHIMVFTGRVSHDSYPGAKPEIMDVQVFGMYKGGDDVFKLNDHNQPDIVVGTMGKLNASLDAHKLNIGNLRLFIADEGDKMMREEGFGKDILNFLEKLPVAIIERMQVATFSATFTYFEDNNGEIDFDKEVLSQLFKRHKPALISVEGVKGYITQRIIYIPHTMPPSLRPEDMNVFERRAEFAKETIRNSYHCKKLGYLLALLNDDREKYYNNVEDKFEKTIVVFVERITTSNFLATFLITKGYKVAPLNSNYDLAAVKNTLDLLVSGKIQAVISTNKLARGQDIPDLHHVIIYEMSHDFDDYKHRIGRTGRIGKGGISTALVTDQDIKHFINLYYFLQEHCQAIPMWLYELYESHLDQTSGIGNSLNYDDQQTSI